MWAGDAGWAVGRRGGAAAGLVQVAGRDTSIYVRAENIEVGAVPGDKIDVLQISVGDRNGVVGVHGMDLIDELSI